MDPHPSYDYHFLLLPEFSFIGFAALMEPLRIANRFRPGASRWRILSEDGGPVTASNGIAIMTDGAITDVDHCDCLFVITSFNPLDHYTPALGAWLRKLDRQGTVLGAIDTGCYILAEAGLLNGATVTLHWEAIPAFMERYPQVKVSQELFKLTPKRLTSAGAVACVDMVLELIAQRHGHDLALTVSDQLVQGRIREPAEHQRMQITRRYNVHHKKLVSAIKVMESHLETPLTTEALAADVGLTRRQLERLFSSYLQRSPASFYLRLRLERSRHLLQQTDLSIVEISIACGFESPSYFSRAYRKHFACSPREDRQGPKYAD